MSECFSETSSRKAQWGRGTVLSVCLNPMCHFWFHISYMYVNTLMNNIDININYGIWIQGVSGCVGTCDYVGLNQNHNTFYMLDY